MEGAEFVCLGCSGRRDQSPNSAPLVAGRSLADRVSWATISGKGEHNGGEKKQKGCGEEVMMSSPVPHVNAFKRTVAP